MGCICGLAAGVVKYLLFAANFLFMLSGIAIIVVGARAQTHFASFDDFFAGTFSGTAITIIVVGSIICIIGFCGCCGAIRKNYCLLMTYSILLLGVLIAEVAVGIVALTEVQKTDEFVNNNLDKFFRDQYSSQTTAPNPTSETFDAIHEQFSCCGLTGPGNFALMRVNVPYSCCGEDATSCNQASAYQTGCKVPFTEWMHNAVQTIGILSLCVALIEVIAIVFACCLAGRYKD